MTPAAKIWLFWSMSALLFVMPLVILHFMPPGRVRDILRRAFALLATAVLLMTGSAYLFLPHTLPRAHLLGGYTFAMLAALLIIVPVAMILIMPQSSLRKILINGILWLAGSIALILGIIGAFTPVLPTVPFILLAAACWGRASPRFHHWLLQHKHFGPMVRSWEEKRAIPKRGKYMAWTMMTLSSTWLLWRFPERWYVGAGTGLVCLCVGLWMARLPDA